MRDYTETSTKSFSPPKETPYKSPGEQENQVVVTQPIYIEEEVTLKEVIVNTQSYLRELRHHWYIIALFTIPIFGYFVYQAHSTDPVYTATITFMVDNEESSGGLSGMTALLSSFGMAGGSRGGSNLERILELSKSRKIVQMALFNQTRIDSMYDYLGNHLIREYNLHEKWNESRFTALHNFHFMHDNVEDFDRAEGAALKVLHSMMIGTIKTPGLMETDIEEASGIMSLSVKTTNEELSLHLADTLYAKMSQFYVDKAIERNLQTYRMVRERADSLNQALESTEYALANTRDAYRNTYLNAEDVRKSRLQRKAAMLSVMYGEAAKNAELAAFALKNQTPFVQVIDYPMAPLPPMGESLFKNGIIGLILGFLFGGTFVIGRKVIRDAMRT